MSAPVFGTGPYAVSQPVTRTEDPRLLRGDGEYTDDRNIQNQVFAFFVRSPIAHGKINSVAVESAKLSPGVLAVFTHDDVSEAVAGDRVGIALRNAKEEHLSGGSLVVHPPIEDKRTGISIEMALDKHENSTLKLSQSPFQKRQLAIGDVVHASVDLQFVVGRVKSIDDGLIVEWESPLFVRKQNPPPVILAQLDSKPRIMGSATLTRLE